MRLKWLLWGGIGLFGWSICIGPTKLFAQNAPFQGQQITSGMYGQASSPSPQLGQQRSTIEGVKPILSFDARDSLILKLSDSTRIGTLFGQANANHEKGLLTAGQVSLYLHKDE